MIVDDKGQKLPVARTLTFNDEGVFLGATRLAPRLRGYERQIHALVSFAVGSLAPWSLLKTLESAIADYVAGDKAMSAMRLALAIPTPPTDWGDYRTIHIAAGLIESGFLEPHELLSLAKIGVPEGDDLSKYSPDQPRVPAGNSDGGEWTSGDGRAPTFDARVAQNATGCNEEWAWARGYCAELLDLPNPPRSLMGGHATIAGCAKGFVSERCGGSKV